MTNTVSPYDAVSVAAGSLLAPGLGQWVQGRHTAAIWFFGEVLGCVLLGVWVPEIRGVAWALAAAINVWSVADAVMAAQRVRDVE